MIAPTHTAFDEVLTLIRAAVNDGDGWADTAQRVRDALHGRLPNPRCLPGHLAGAAVDRLASRALHTEPNGAFSVVALECPPDGVTVIHDHVTWCVFAVLAGTLVEERFLLDESGGHLMPAGDAVCPAGTLTGGAPPGDIHRLANPTSGTAVSLHIYGTDVSRIDSSVRRTYDLPVLTPKRMELS